MVSYIKTQWWRILIALFCLVMSCIYALKPAPEVLTVEALDEVMSNMITANMLFTGFVIWSFISFISHNQNRIELLEKKAEKYDALVNKVDALQELLETESKYSNHLNKRIDSLVYVVEELKKK